MNGIIIQITPEEFQDLIDSAVDKALQKFTPGDAEVEYLTRNEVSERIHVSLPTLNEYTKTGRILSCRIKGRVLYRKQDVDAALTVTEPLKYCR